MKQSVIILFAFLFFSKSFGQILHPAEWSYAAKKINSTEAVVFIKATLAGGWHIYGQHIADGGPVKTSFSF